MRCAAVCAWGTCLCHLTCDREQQQWLGYNRKKFIPTHTHTLSPFLKHNYIQHTHAETLNLTQTHTQTSLIHTQTIKETQCLLSNVSFPPTIIWRHAHTHNIIEGKQIMTHQTEVPLRAWGQEGERATSPERRSEREREECRQREKRNGELMIKYL